jgi:hypothetical protein
LTVGQDGATPQHWYGQYRRTVRGHQWADPLRDAALAGRLREWTQHLTDAVVATCAALGWQAAGRGHPGQVLPVSRHEYLGIDVMAFEGAETGRWQRPVAAFELENRPDAEAIAYSLWKVAMVRCPLGGVFCYRKDPEQVGPLVEILRTGVMSDIAAPGPGTGDILLVVGTRSKAEAFPDSFFRPYTWEPGTRRFRALL